MLPEHYTYSTNYVARVLESWIFNRYNSEATGITVLRFPGAGWLLGPVTFVNLTTCRFFISVI